jgi:hypothetical protein
VPPLGGRTQIRSYISFCKGGGGPPRREEDGAEAGGQPALREAGQELRHWSGGAPISHAVFSYLVSSSISDPNGSGFKWFSEFGY